jgi:hypothetical protein
MSLIKSQKRVADHGEVFTPAWMVEAMLDLVKGETERIDSRFLEPACGSGNFLVRILQRKLAAVELKYGKSDFEKRHYALLALMCTYGIELLPDNIAECRANMLDPFRLLESRNRTNSIAAFYVPSNLVHGDAVHALDVMITSGRLPRQGKFSRDFGLASSPTSAFSAGSLFAHPRRRNLHAEKEPR